MNKTTKAFISIFAFLLLCAPLFLSTSASQAKNESRIEVAQIIYETGKRLGANDKAMLAAFEAAVVETDMRNLAYGSSDSIGVFQQRPSAGWGTKKQIMKVSYAARVFFKGNPSSKNPKGAIYFSKYTDMKAHQIAQRVQLSAFPERYKAARGEALDWIEKANEIIVIYS